MTDFKVAMTTWQGGDCECNICFFMFAAEQLNNVMIFYYIVSICHCIYHCASSSHINRSCIFPSLSYSTLSANGTVTVLMFLLLHKPTLNKVLFYSYSGREMLKFQ